MLKMDGKKFGRLIVLERAGSRNRRTLYKCRCDCGNEIFVIGKNLRNGNTKSCGCLWKEKVTKHGMNGTKLYKTWANMVERCQCKSASHFKQYGGRGIRLCDEWKDFKNFAAWAFDNGYVEEHKRGEVTLDRINPDGNYEPTNCRWISNKEQQNNRTDNRFIEYNGDRHTLKEWADILGINSKTLSYRLDKGWEIKKAFFTPPQRRGRA